MIRVTNMDQRRMKEHVVYRKDHNTLSYTYEDACVAFLGSRQKSTVHAEHAATSEKYANLVCYPDIQVSLT